MFAPVTMLYCHMEVNGVPVKAFIDSGAQMTIMTEDFAKRCHLERLLDTRFHGTAVGVGSSRILGRVHAAPMKVAGHFITSSITVLEQKSGPQFIFGLDMLKRHRCRLEFAPDAKAAVSEDAALGGEGGAVVTGPHLHFGSCGVALPFLGDAEIPRDFAHDALEDRSEEAAAKSMSQAVGGGAAAAAGGGGGGAAAGGAAAGGSQPPASGAGAAGAPAAAPSAAANDDKAARLMALGFPRKVCEEALVAAGGNEDAAAAILFGGLDG